MVEPVPPEPRWLQEVARKAATIRFGEVKVIIRDGKPVRIERYESEILTEEKPRGA